MVGILTALKSGYPDLLDENYVYEALLGYGMFTNKLPNCFSSKDFFDYVLNNDNNNKPIQHNCIDYNAARDTNIPRQLAIPHPESYWRLCKLIKDNWEEINIHIGKPKPKVNYCHVRKQKDKKCIFDMNFEGYDRWTREENDLDYSLGCRYIVSADISTCFSSIYSHLIPWAVKGKDWAKVHRCNSRNKKKKKGENCKINGQNPCPHELNDLWVNDLDNLSTANKDGETNGLPIGPHSSNIIAELILTCVDVALQNKGYKKLIRYIDDYKFFAKDEKEAKDFLSFLTLELKKYELTLNAKKTSIIQFKDSITNHWIAKLNQFSLPDEELGFTAVNSYIDYAVKLSEDNRTYTPLNYALKLMSNKELSDRAKRLYIKKVLQLAIERPYILPLLEDYVFVFTKNHSFFKEFLIELIKRGIYEVGTDSIAFGYYFAIKYKIDLKLKDDKLFLDTLKIGDCISSFLCYKYCEFMRLDTKIFKKAVKEILKLSEREIDKQWLFVYEVSSKSSLKGFLKTLKENNISFYKQPAVT